MTLGRYRAKYQKICLAKLCPIPFPPTAADVNIVVIIFASISGEIITTVDTIGRQKSHHTESTEKDSPKIWAGTRQFGLGGGTSTIHNLATNMANKEDTRVPKILVQDSPILPKKATFCTRNGARYSEPTYTITSNTHIHRLVMGIAWIGASADIKRSEAQARQEVFMFGRGTDMKPRGQGGHPSQQIH